MTSHRLGLVRIILFGVDLNSLRDFYVQNFGCSVIEETPGEWIVLDTGEVELALHKVGKEFEPESGGAFRAESNVKMVFRLHADISEFRSMLLTKGVKMGDIRTFHGNQAFFCDGEDPEGNVFQIQQDIKPG